jgi:hypothetical protein
MSQGAISEWSNELGQICFSSARKANRTSALTLISTAVTGKIDVSQYNTQKGAQRATVTLS